MDLPIVKVQQKTALCEAVGIQKLGEFLAKMVTWRREVVVSVRKDALTWFHMVSYGHGLMMINHQMIILKKYTIMKWSNMFDSTAKKLWSSHET